MIVVNEIIKLPGMLEGRYKGCFVRFEQHADGGLPEPALPPQRAAPSGEDL